MNRNRQRTVTIMVAEYNAMRYVINCASVFRRTFLADNCSTATVEAAQRLSDAAHKLGQLQGGQEEAAKAPKGKSP